MKHYKYLLTFLLLCSGIGAWADNIITLSDVQGAAGTEVTVSISLTNSDAVSAMQLSIPLGDNLTFVTNSQQKGNRISGHTLSVGVKDGVLNVMVYSNTMATMSGNDGEVCSFKLLLGNNPGTISFNPSKAALTGSDGSSLAVTVSAGTVDIRGAKAKLNYSTLNFGRVGIGNSVSQSLWVQNVGNEPLEITDVSFSSTVFSATTELPVAVNAGSSLWIYVSCTPTAFGDIDEEMVISSNSVSGNSHVRLTATPYAVNELRLDDTSGTTGEEVTIGVSMKNYNEITGLQMEIELPEGLEFVDGSFELSSRKQDHTATASLTGNTLSIVAYSMTDKAFTGSDGEIGSFKIKIVGGNSASLDFKKAMMSSNIDGKTVDVLSDKYGCYVNVMSPKIVIYNGVDFGNIIINQENVEQRCWIYNRGDAPLTISNIVFANGLFSVKEQLPLTIAANSLKTIAIEYNALEEGDVSTTMEIYSNDPNNRLYVVNITGTAFAPNYLNANINVDNEAVNLTISLDNYSDIYGIQFDIESPIHFWTKTSDVILSDRAKGLLVNINAISQNKLRVMAYSQGDQCIASGNGEVMTIKLNPSSSLASGDYSMTLSQILLGSKNLQNKYTGDSEILLNYSVAETFPGIIEPSIVTVINARRKYGDKNPIFDYTVTGGELDGTPEITCSASETSAVGDYPIKISKGSVTNSDVTFIDGTLTVKTAPLTVSVGNYTRKVGEDNPQFILTYKGFKNNETEDVLTQKPVATTMATKNSVPGDYPITVYGGQAQNYDISYVNGVLTVEGVIGDANGDGKVDINDAVCIMNYLVGKLNTTFAYGAADVDGDGNVDISDAVGVVNIILNK